MEQLDPGIAGVAETFITGLQGYKYKSMLGNCSCWGGGAHTPTLAWLVVSSEEEEVGTVTWAHLWQKQEASPVLWSWNPWILTVGSTDFIARIAKTRQSTLLKAFLRLLPRCRVDLTLTVGWSCAENVEPEECSSTLQALTVGSILHLVD